MTIFATISRMPAISIFGIVMIRFLLAGANETLPHILIAAIDTLIFLFILLWYFSINIELNKTIYGRAMVIGRLFLVCTIYSALYSVLGQISIIHSYDFLRYMSGLCVIYIMYATSKAILDAEGKKYSAIDIATLVILFVLLPIGIWVVKGRINSAINRAAVTT